MKLLLAEDERELSDALSVILKYNHYSVDAVYDGQEAYDYLMAEEYDGAILDVMMPKLDGITVLKRIRREGNTVPVLILTAKAEIDDRVLGLDAGADDYLTKPFATKELLARVRSVTRRRTEAVSADIRFGNLTLDSAKFELTGPKGTQHLPNREYQMLELLMANPNQVISTEHFLERIWGYETDADTSVVWVYISYIRKRLRELGANVRIQAVRGQGYSLRECE